MVIVIMAPVGVSFKMDFIRFLVSAGHFGSHLLLDVFFFPPQLRFTFNIILYYSFQVDSIVVKQSYTLQSVPPS